MLKLSKQELNIICEALKVFMQNKPTSHNKVKPLLEKLLFTKKTNKSLNESLNEYAQITDRVIYDKLKGNIIGQLGDKFIVQVQGSTYLVNSDDIKEFYKKQNLTTKPHMKFDEKTQKLLFEQYVKCGIYNGNVPIKLNDCYVKYNQWEKATPEQQIKVLVEGSIMFFPKQNIRIFENINDFANPENYVPGALIDEATEQVLENILINVIDYTNAIGDADSIRIIKTTPTGEQEIQTVPRSMVRTLAV